MWDFPAAASALPLIPALSPRAGRARKFWFLLPDSGWSEIIRDGQVCGFAATLGAAAISAFNRHAHPDHAGLVSVSNLIMPLLPVGALITLCAALSQPAIGEAQRYRLCRRVIGASLHCSASYCIA